MRECASLLSLEFIAELSDKIYDSLVQSADSHQGLPGSLTVNIGTRPMIRRAFYSRILSADVLKITRALASTGTETNRTVATKVAAATEYVERLLKSFPERDRPKVSVLLSIGPTQARRSRLIGGARDWSDPDWAFAALLETWLTVRAQLLTYKHLVLIVD